MHIRYTMNTEKKYTSIRVRVQTKERLAKLGKKDDSYDYIINKLIDFYEEKNNDKKYKFNHI